MDQLVEQVFHAEAIDKNIDNMIRYVEPNYAHCWHRANQASYYFGAVLPPAHNITNVNEIEHPDAKIWFKLTAVNV